MAENNMKKEIESLKKEITVLREENLFLAGKAEDIIHLGLISEKILEETTKEGIIGIVLKTISTVKNISYCAYLSIADHSMKVMDDAGPDLSESFRGKVFGIDRELREKVYGRICFVELQDGVSIPEFIPPEVGRLTPNSFYLSPVIVRNDFQEMFLFVNSMGDCGYLRAMIPLIDCVTETVNNRLENISLVSEIEDISRTPGMGGRKRTQDLVEMNAPPGIEIKERKRAEEISREAEEKFRNLAEKSLVGVYLIQEGIFKYVNSKLAEIFGYSVDELIGKKGPKDLTFPDDRQTVEENLRKRVEGETDAIQYEFRGWTKERKIIFVEVYGSRFSYQGRPAVIGTLLDISDKKKYEDKIKLYKDVFDNSRDAIAIIDPMGFYLEQNAAHKELIGYPDDELKGMTPAVHLGEKTFNDIAEALEQDGFYRGEVVSMKKNGEEAFIDLSSFPVMTAESDVAFFVSIKRDITDRKRAESKILHLDSLLRSVFEINRLITRENNMDNIFDGVCDITHKVRGYHFVWIGLIAVEHKRVLPKAQSGFESGYLKDVVITWDDSPTGRGPTGTAIKTGKTSVMRDILADPGYKSWREAALNRGYRSSIAVPLISGKDTYGALNVYSDKPDAFDSEEVTLLEQMSDDVAYAIKMIGIEEQRRQYEQDLEEYRNELEKKVKERTEEFRKTINLMSGREVRMAELKRIIKKLRKQLEDAGIAPAFDDPLDGDG